MLSQFKSFFLSPYINSGVDIIQFIGLVLKFGNLFTVSKKKVIL